LYPFKDPLKLLKGLLRASSRQDYQMGIFLDITKHLRKTG
jgi:hypothetical protein